MTYLTEVDIGKVDLASPSVAVFPRPTRSRLQFFDITVQKTIRSATNGISHNGIQYLKGPTKLNTSRLFRVSSLCRLAYLVTLQAIGGS